jgi:hypothetical protein
MRARWRREAVGWRTRAGAGEREAGRWGRLQGVVQLAVGRESITGGPGLGKENKDFDSNLKLIFQIYSNLIRSKQDLPELGKFEIKYKWKVFEIWNNFSYRDFLRFEMEFEEKFREVSMS